MDNQIEQMPTTPISYLFSFFGGYIGALSFFLKTSVSISFSDLLATINYPDLFNYTLRSILGGVIAIIIKILYDLILRFFKKLFKKEDKNE